MKPAAFGYARPDTLRAALALLADEHLQARPMAGGQSLMPMLSLRLSRPDVVLDLWLLEELQGIRRQADGIEVGALTTHAQIEDGLLDDVAGGYLTRVAGGIAYRAIRNHGTVGGSLAHADPAADWPVALSALDARVRLAGAAGTRELPLADFFQAPFSTALAEGELIRAIHIPARGARTRWAYVKQARKTGEFAESIVAAIVDEAGGFARIAVGGLGGVPVLLLDRPDHALLQRGRPLPGLAALGRMLEAAAAAPVDPVALRIHAATLTQALQALRALRAGEERP